MAFDPTGKEKVFCTTMANDINYFAVPIPATFVMRRHIELLQLRGEMSSSHSKAATGEVQKIWFGQIGD